MTNYSQKLINTFRAAASSQLRQLNETFLIASSNYDITEHILESFEKLTTFI